MHSPCTEERRQSVSIECGGTRIKTKAIQRITESKSDKQWKSKRNFLSPSSGDAYVLIRLFMLSALFVGLLLLLLLFTVTHCMPSLVLERYVKILAAISIALWQHRFPCRTIVAITIYSTRVKNLCLLVFGLVLSPRDVHDAFRAIESAALLFSLFSFTCVSFFRLSVVGFVSRCFFFFRHDIFSTIVLFQAFEHIP